MFTLHDVRSRQPVFAQAGETLTLTGTVTEKNDMAFYTANYVIKTQVAGVNTSVRIIAPENSDVAVGDEVVTEATLRLIRDTATFPERSYNHARGILLGGNADYVTFVGQGEFSFLTRIRAHNEYVQNEIGLAFPGEVGDLLRAVTLGDTSGLSPEMRQNVRIAGASHYTAVSGLHMTLVAHIAMLVFAFTPWEKNRRVKFAFMLVALAALSVFWGLSVSVIRAAIMLVITFGGEVFMRRGTTFNSLGFALFAILLFEPYAVFDAGLLMSFSGTFGVGVIAPLLLKNADKTKLFRIKELFVASACASLCVLPVSAIYFGGFSFLSLLTSVVILPFFTVAVGGVMLFAALCWYPPLAQLPLLVAGLMSRIMTEMLAFGGSFRWSWLSLDYWFVPLWIALALSAIAIVHVSYKSVKSQGGSALPNPAEGASEARTPGVKRSVKATAITLAALLLMTRVYDYHATRSQRVYITIASDSVAAVVQVRQGETELLIVTADTPRIHALMCDYARSPTAVVLLGRARNNEKSFIDFAKREQADYLSPSDTDAVYDISGRFTLDIQHNRDDEVMLTIGDYTILFTRASNGDASPADIIIASGSVRRKREFDSDCVVYVSRSVPILEEYEHSAYFEPLYYIIEP